MGTQRPTDRAALPSRAVIAAMSPTVIVQAAVA